MKKLAGSVRFYKQKIEKTKPNRNRKNQKKNRAKTEPNRKNQANPEKPSQTGKNRAKTGENRAKTRKIEPNRFEPVFSLKNRTELKPVGLTLFWFFLKFSLITFFNKNHIELKIITLLVFHYNMRCSHLLFRI